MSHCTDRHGLFVILAIGGSVVAIGGAAGQPISMPRLVTASVLLLALPAATFLPPLFGPAGLVLSCLQVTLEEEWEHSRYGNRDLGILGARRR